MNYIAPCVTNAFKLREIILCMSDLTRYDLDKVINVLSKWAKYDPSEVFDKRGKITNFHGKIKLTNNESGELGFLFYPWKRILGVNKVTQAARLSRIAGLNGAFIVTNEYSAAAEEQAKRINDKTNTKVYLISSENLEQSDLNSRDELI